MTTTLTAEKTVQLQIPHAMRYPLSFYQGVPFISGKLNGRDVTFIYDSGGQDLLLNGAHFDYPHLDESAGYRGFLSEHKSYYTRMHSLEFGDWQIRNVDAMVGDLSAIEP